MIIKLSLIKKILINYNLKNFIKIEKKFIYVKYKIKYFIHLKYLYFFKYIILIRKKNFI